LGSVRARPGEPAHRRAARLARSPGRARAAVAGCRSRGRRPEARLYVLLARQDGWRDRDHGGTETAMTASPPSADVRRSIVNIFRRDLVGPGPLDADLARERLNESPSRWYLTGFLAPADDPLTQDGATETDENPSTQEEMEIDVEEPADDGAG